MVSLSEIITAAMKIHHLFLLMVIKGVKAAAVGTQSLCTWTLSQLVKSTRRRVMLTMGFVMLFAWLLTCHNDESHLVVNNLCINYSSRHVVGNLCQDLCEPGGEMSLDCGIFYHDKKTVFFGTWRNYSAAFKYIKKTSTETKPLYSMKAAKKIKVKHVKNDFTLIVKSNVKSLFNISINDVDAKRIAHTNYKTYNVVTEIENIWPLLEHKEYLASFVYEKYEIFPKLLGTCGSLFAVQRLKLLPTVLRPYVAWYDSNDWWLRIKMGILIMDYLIKIEDELPESLHICNIQLYDFGVTKDLKKVMYLNLDSVHPYSIASKKTGDGSDCKRHSDCDFLDCRSFCNLETFKCEFGVANNNLQIVCEKIFLGITMWGRLSLPGLLMGPYTPRVLVEALELCANPFGEVGTARAPANLFIRQALYRLLTHINLSCKQ